jgi:hypothetical protein
MFFAATTLAAASAVLPVTDAGAAMCGAAGAPSMDPWFRRFELEQSQKRTYCHADRRDQIQRETEQRSVDHHRA